MITYSIKIKEISIRELEYIKKSFQLIDMIIKGGEDVSITFNRIDDMDLVCNYLYQKSISYKAIQEYKEIV